jgi:hypothetical protein
MGSKPAKIAFLVIAAIFFAALALDIYVPAVVLGAMGLSNWLVLSAGGTPPVRRRRAV